MRRKSWRTLFHDGTHVRQGPQHIVPSQELQIEPVIRLQQFNWYYLFNSTFEHDDGNFDAEEMLPFDDAVDFDATFESLFRNFLNLNVNTFHSCFSNVWLGLSDTTD